jgi:hypothetical protein
MIPFKGNVSNKFLGTFYIWNRSWNRILEKDHGFGSDRGKIDRAPAVLVPVQAKALQHCSATHFFLS